MPRTLLDPKDIQTAPVGLGLPPKGGKWQHVDALGEFAPVVPNKLQTGMTTRSEKERGVLSIRIKDGVREELTQLADKIIDEKPTKIDTEVKDGIGSIGTPGVEPAVGGTGSPRGSVDAGGRSAGRTERMVPR